MLHPTLIVFLADATEPVAAAIIAAILGPIGAYVVAARKMSGKIGTSDADQLWAESKAIRDWSTNRLEAQENEIRDLRSALSDLTSRCSRLENENASLKDELGKAYTRIAELENRLGIKEAG